MTYKKYFFILMVVFAGLQLACNNNKDANPSQLISGTDHKTWHPVKETNAEGDREKLTDAEEEEAWMFYANGTVSMNYASQTTQGTWTYDASAKTLSITPTGAPTSSAFTVSELDDDKMVLQSPDGSTMKLKAED